MISFITSLLFVIVTLFAEDECKNEAASSLVEYNR